MVLESGLEKNENFNISSSLNQVEKNKLFVTSERKIDPQSSQHTICSVTKGIFPAPPPDPDSSFFFFPAGPGFFLEAGPALGAEGVAAAGGGVAALLAGAFRLGFSSAESSLVSAAGRRSGELRLIATSFFRLATASESTSELDSSCFIFLESFVATFLSFSLILRFWGVGCCDATDEAFGVDDDDRPAAAAALGFVVVVELLVPPPPTKRGFVATT